MNGKREHFNTLWAHINAVMRKYFKSKWNTWQCILIRHVVLWHEGAKCRQDWEIVSNVLGTPFSKTTYGWGSACALLCPVWQVGMTKYEAAIQVRSPGVSSRSNKNTRLEYQPGWKCTIWFVHVRYAQRLGSWWGNRECFVRSVFCKVMFVQNM